MLEENTEYATVYDNGDGTKTAYVYTEPIRYKDENGNLVDIDNSIVEIENNIQETSSNDKALNIKETDNIETTKKLNIKENEGQEENNLDKENKYTYKNKSNTLNVYLPDNLLGDTGVLVESNAHSVEIIPNTKDKINYQGLEILNAVNESEIINKDDGSKKKEKTSVQYKSNFGEEIELEYFPTDNGVKENIILKSYTGINTFEFKLKFEDMYPKVVEDGRIQLFDNNTDELVGELQDCYMMDSSEPYNYSDKVKMKISKLNSNEYILKITADKKFLENPKTVYPVKIDPTVTMSGEYDTFDAFVQSKYSNSNYYLVNHIKTGWADEIGTVRSYVKFNLPNISNGMITSAKVKFYEFTGNTSNAYTDLYRVASNWTSSTIKWSNKPSYTGGYYERKTVNHSGWYEWNITSLASGWYSGSIPNYGFVLKDKDENGRFRRFYSSDNGSNKPVLTVNYSSKPAAPTVSVYSTGVNKTTGYANISWGAVSGAAKYKVGIFNGTTYQWFETTSTSWSTNGKAIWPTTAEIQSGRYTLHTDGHGAELANDPNPVYVNAHGGYEGNHNYWFRVIAVNSSGQESGWSAAAMPTMPDSTSPRQPSTPGISVSNGAAGSGNSATINASWSGVSDLPSFSNSGIKQYRVELYVNGSLNETKNTTGTSTSFTNKPDNSSVYVKVRAEDNKGNYSGFSPSSTVTTGDRTAPTAPGSVTINPGSWTNNTNPTITWSGINDEGNHLNVVQYQIDSQGWKPSGGTTSSGSCNISTSSLSEGQHTIYIRGLDSAGNTGASNSVIYYKDTTSPVAGITYPSNNVEVDGIVNIKGTLSDSNLNNWKLEYGAGENPSSYQTLAQGTTAKNNEILYSWNVSGYSEQSRHTLKLTVTDKAGNVKTAFIVVTKSNNPQNTNSEINITNPGPGSELTQSSNVVEYDNNQNNTDKLFINNILVDEESVPTEGLTIPSINYNEESINEIYIKSTDPQGNNHYSVGSHKKTIYANTFTDTNGLLLSHTVKSTENSIKLDGTATEGTVEIASGSLISTSGSLSTVKLIESSTKPAETQITYQIKLGNGQWININPNIKIDIEDINNGALPRGQVNIRAVLTTNNVSVTPEISNWQLEIAYVDDGQTFSVKLLQEPTGVTAFPNVNYKTLLRWSSVYNYADNVTYNIYRGTTESFIPTEENKIASGITDKYWYDSNLNYGQTFYYKVTVQKEISSAPRESVTSNTAFATVVVMKMNWINDWVCKTTGATAHLIQGEEQAT